MLNRDIMNNVSKILNVNEKLACITLDFELDYGDRIGEFNILEDNEKDLFDLATLFSDFDIPISTFIRTDILTNYPKSLDVIKKIAKDYHCHSHTHNTKSFDSRIEISNSASTFKRYFGYKPVGYRAPQGVLYNKDIDFIKKCGFKFSASIFPSYRPGKFNNLSTPIDPFVYDNGIMELPFAVIPKLRYTVSLSYLKLLGINMNKILFSMFGLPSVVVFDSHLHDYIVNEKSFSKLPPQLRIAWGKNKYLGIKYFSIFIELLRKKKYRLITMTQLHNYLKEAYL
jgi:hypothetical protein